VSSPSSRTLRSHAGPGMPHVSQRALAVCLAGIALVPTAIGGWFAWLDRNSDRDILGVQTLYAFGVLVALAVGLRVVWRFPRERGRIGWILLSGGCLAAVILMTDYATYALVVKRPGNHWLGLRAAWAGDVLLYGGMLGLVPLLALLYPNGRLPSKDGDHQEAIWFWIIPLIVASEVLAGAGIWFERRLISFPNLAGPFANESVSRWAAGVKTAGLIVGVLSLTASSASVLVRYMWAKRRGDPPTLASGRKRLGGSLPSSGICTRHWRATSRARSPSRCTSEPLRSCVPACRSASRPC
jgi:hypothetical protein